MATSDGDGDFWKVGKDAYSTAGSIWGGVKQLGTAVGVNAAESTPGIGTAVGVLNAVRKSAQAHDAERKHDFDEADYYKGEANYNWLKAVPVVGTMLGGAELAGGLWNAATGGEFAEGSNLAKDWAINKVHDSDKNHTELRHNHDERERMEASIKAKKEARREAQVDRNMRNGGSDGAGNTTDAEIEQRRQESWNADARRRDREASIDPEMRNGGSEGVGNVPDPDAAERRREAENADAERERRVDPNMRNGGYEGGGNY